MGKIRLDALLVKNGQVQSRERAKALIMAGQVYVKNQKCDKAGQMVDEDTTVAEIRGETLKYVSRGGLKLEKAMQEFPITLEGKTTMDIGASTGGFTDCMLQNGAVKVFAVDVGYGQFAWKLRQDERVVNMERTNIRYVTPEQLGEPLDLSVVDVSFISLKLVLPVIKTLLKPTGQVLCLIKPQFEAGKEKVGKKGVVREKSTHKEVLDNFVALADELQFKILGLTFSPVKGPEGNIEFLGHLTLDNVAGSRPDTALVVESAHQTLDKGEIHEKCHSDPQSLPGQELSDGAKRYPDSERRGHSAQTVPAL